MTPCLILAVTVAYAQSTYVEQAEYEFCGPITSCLETAEGFIWELQMAGELPGSREVIRYEARCLGWV